jgi:long-chain fatty acid transport protein
VAFNDALSFGAAANINLQALRANLATAPNYFETAGGGKWDYAPGGGFTVGLLYQLHKMMGLGASFESHQWMGHHHRYKDCLPFIDGPPVMNVGVSLKPTDKLELTYDTRYINWTDVKLARNGPESGGFGWGDQWVFAFGGEYAAIKDKLKLRLGYNYGKSPIQNHVVFANALLGLIMEHHLTTGFSYYITKDLSLDCTWEHHFKNVMADNGCGDLYSRSGAGTKISAAAEVISIGLGYKY